MLPGSYPFFTKLEEVTMDVTNTQGVADALTSTGSTAGVGIDQKLISTSPSHNPSFISHNFTPSKIAYCNSQLAPALSFIPRWGGKSAIFKSFDVPSKGTGAAILDIKILPNDVVHPR